ncbi:MAG: hypothetical protein HND47_24615 [Chloroflexi bacterium]|nr:hypothetical protein [Chloroflexota bacterium]
MRALFRFALFLLMGVITLAACAKEEWDIVTLGDGFLVDEDRFRGVALTEEGDKVILKALKEIELTR